MSKKKGSRKDVFHHRLPRSRGGTEDSNNLSRVSRKRHRAWHLIAGNMNAKEIAKTISDIWIDPDYYLVAVPRHQVLKKSHRLYQNYTNCQLETFMSMN